MNKQPRDFEYIGFDLDGTLMNTYEGIANGLRHVLKSYEMGEPTEAQIRFCIGPPLDGSLQTLYGFSVEESKKAVEKFREFYGPIGQHQCQPYEGIEEVLKALKGLGKKLFVATSKPIAPARSILERFGLAKYFMHIEGTPPGSGDCSKADVLNAAFASLGNPPLDNIILIGDTKFDIIGAKTVGISAMGVLYGFGSREDFIEHGADFIVDNVSDIIKSFK